MCIRDRSVAACNRYRIEQVETFCNAAGIRADSIMPLAAGAALGLTTLPDGLFLLQAGDSVELAAAVDRRLTWLRSFGHADLDTSHLAADMRLVLTGAASLPRDQAIILGDDSLQETASEVMGTGVVQAAVQNHDGPADYVAAFAAGTRQRDESNCFNFVAPTDRRVAESRRARLQRIAAVVALVLLLIAWPAYNWGSARSRAAEARKALAAMAPLAENANRLRDQIETTDPWCDRPPVFMEAMRALTAQFPERGSIWLITCEVDEAGTMEMTGKARSHSEVLDLLDRMEECGQFDRIANHHVRQQTGRDNTITFSASCRYMNGAGS